MFQLVCVCFMIREILLMKKYCIRLYNITFVYVFNVFLIHLMHDFPLLKYTQTHYNNLHAILIEILSVHQLFG